MLKYFSDVNKNGNTADESMTFKCPPYNNPTCLKQRSQLLHVKILPVCVSTVTLSCHLSSLHPLNLVPPLSFLSLLPLPSPMSALLSSSFRIGLSIVLHALYICVNTRLTCLYHSLLPVPRRMQAAVP